MYPQQNRSRQPAPYTIASSVYNQNNGSFGSSSQGLQSVGSTSGLHSFQVKISENYTIPPPMDYSRFEFRPVSNSEFELDLSVNRELLAKYRGNEDDENAPAKQPSEEFYPVVDPWGETVKHFVRKGHSRESVCLALAIFPDSEEDQVSKKVDPSIFNVFFFFR